MKKYKIIEFAKGTLIAVPAVAALHQNAVLVVDAATINQCEVEQTRDNVFDFAGGIGLIDDGGTASAGGGTSTLAFRIVPDIGIPDIS